MMIEFHNERAVFSQVVGVDDAEQLLAWLQQTPGAFADLQCCTHLHPANLQVLMAAATPVSVWPDDAALAAWLKTALMERTWQLPVEKSNQHEEKQHG